MPSAPKNCTPNEWETIEDCVTVFKPIEQLITKISGEKYRTLSSIFPLFRNVQAFLSKMNPSTAKGKNLNISWHSAITKCLGILETKKDCCHIHFFRPTIQKSWFDLEANAKSYPMG